MLELPNEAVALSREELEGVGAEVEGLCDPSSHPGNLERFREKIEICRTMALSYRDQCRKAERAREGFERELYLKYRRHISRIRRIPRLQRKDLGPPSRDHSWQEFLVPEKRKVERKRRRLRLQREELGPPSEGHSRQETHAPEKGKAHRCLTYEVFYPLAGWVKVRDAGDFVRPKFDQPRSPLLREEWEPQPRHHEPGDLLYGYYWLLAAIHDKFYAKRFLIIEDDQRQWPVDMLQHLWFAKDMASSRLTAFEGKTALREVKADLEKQHQSRACQEMAVGQRTDAGKAAIAGVGSTPTRAPKTPAGEWTELDMAILEVLHYSALRGEAIAKVIKRRWPTVRDALGKQGRLRSSGIVDNRRGLGYYRTDAPPDLDVD